MLFGRLVGDIAKKEVDATPNTVMGRSSGYTRGARSRAAGTRAISVIIAAIASRISFSFVSVVVTLATFTLATLPALSGVVVVRRIFIVDVIATTHHAHHATLTATHTAVVVAAATTTLSALALSTLAIEVAFAALALSTLAFRVVSFALATHHAAAHHATTLATALAVELSAFSCLVSFALSFSSLPHVALAFSFTLSFSTLTLAIAIIMSYLALAIHVLGWLGLVGCCRLVGLDLFRGLWRLGRWRRG
jgi:hypothetical protein